MKLQKGVRTGEPPSSGEIGLGDSLSSVLKNAKGNQKKSGMDNTEATGGGTQSPPQKDLSKHKKWGGGGVSHSKIQKPKKKKKGGNLFYNPPRWYKGPHQGAKGKTPKGGVKSTKRCFVLNLAARGGFWGGTQPKFWEKEKTVCDQGVCGKCITGHNQGPTMPALTQLESQKKGKKGRVQKKGGENPDFFTQPNNSQAI